MYATTDQIGMSLECPDCFTQTLVKSPREEAKPAAPRMDKGFGYEVGPEADLVQSKSHAEELLQEADKYVEQKQEEEPELLDKPLLSGVLTYPFHGNILPVLLGISLGWCVVLVLIKIAWDMQGHAALLAPFLVAGTGIVLALVTFPTLVSFQKMLENTSNGDELTDCRPEGGLFAIIDWIGDVIPLSVAIFLSCAPGMIVVKSLQLPDIYLVGMALSAWLIFPVVYLSMLENASVTGLYSKAVLGSFRQMTGNWFLFYISSTLAFTVIGAAVFGLIRLAGQPASGKSAAAAIACLIAIVMSLAIQFRLIGRLGFVMTQKILIDSDDVEPTEPPSEEMQSHAEAAKA